MRSGFDAIYNNSIVCWSVLSGARGFDVVLRETHLCVDGTDRFSSRIILREALSDPSTLMSDAAVVARGSLTIEDSFGSFRGDELGLMRRQLPLMMRVGRAPSATPSDVSVRRVVNDEDWLRAERTVVEVFAPPHYLPYQPGQFWPLSLRTDGRVDVFMAEHESDCVGAAMTVADAGVVGIYWVATLPAFRSRGVGRAVMAAALRNFDGGPMTLAASEMGAPLYTGMGFDTLGTASFWSRAE